jgi:hypothetical protein
MSTDNNRIEINVVDLGTAVEIIENLAGLKPLTSFSFSLNEEGVSAVNEVLRLVEWGIGKNKPKLKEAALEVLLPLVEPESGTPLNVNLNEYEVKSMEEVLALIERALDKHKDGVLTR